MPRIVLVVLLVALVVYAFIDCVRTPEDSMPVGIPKALWAILILVFPALGALAWLFVSRFARGARPSPPPGRGGVRPGGPRSPRGPVAPDDDPEFLARLEAERRRRERERRAKEAAGSAGGPVTDDGRPPRSPDEVSPDDAPHSPDEAAHGGAEPQPGRDVEDGDAGAQPPRQA